MKQENLRNKTTFKNQNGITLIALVVTIVVLLILAGITVNMLFNNGGIFKIAQDAVNAWNEATVNEQESLNSLADQIANLVNGQVGGGSGGEETPGDPWIPPETVEEAIEQDKIFKETKQIKDKYNNTIMVPKGFKIVSEGVKNKATIESNKIMTTTDVSENNGTTVTEGIVIEDANQNQFVWIPVGIVHKDNNTENDVTIKLGRYTFDTTNGTPTMQQAAFAGDNPSSPSQTYQDEVIIDSHYKELTVYRPGTLSSGLDGLNATAKKLKEFVESVEKNGGYYLARYEASYDSGNSTEDWKPLSKISTGTPRGKAQNTIPLVHGMLWNFVTQLEASKICQNMYANDNSVGVESDLTNSYAWDTAIVFIQSMNLENSNYANKVDGSEKLKNTGETDDKVCNIYDMAINIPEWTTEYSSYTNATSASPSTSRGGFYDTEAYYTADRYYNAATKSGSGVGFRPILYVK